MRMYSLFFKEVFDALLMMISLALRLTSAEKVRGFFFGWVSLLRSEPTELVQASTETLVLATSSSFFITTYKENSNLSTTLNRTSDVSESFNVISKYFEASGSFQQDRCQQILRACDSVQPRTLRCLLQNGEEQSSFAKNRTILISTPSIGGYKVGSVVQLNDALTLERPGLNVPIRFLSIPETTGSVAVTESDVSQIQLATNPELDDASPANFAGLGIIEANAVAEETRFPVVKGHGPHQEALAICEMLCLQQKVPFRRDAIDRVVKDQIRRDKGVTLELIGGLTELLGMQTSIAQASKENFRYVEPPSIFYVDDVPAIWHGYIGDQAFIAHPHQGLQKLQTNQLDDLLPDVVRFITPRRSEATPTTRFSWSWFTPLLAKYKKSLVLVFLTSLLAQLFALGIPLLLQQIIDKVLAQGNLSSLNILGTAMILMALFQGLLQVLRTYIFVDTTDRMDLTLGSSVISRLLSLPLTYFEKRPVGELSQRLGELNSIRSFLTGTALISVLNILFAAIYLVVMFLYSPLLSVISLSTLPVYVLMILVVAPIYRSLIRKRAVAQASTQSHLIEVLGGIQTVKAQHFELTARWKWQDRYRKFVSEGFKSVALGAAAGEFGNFLNQLSGLLVLWVGMGLVLKGEFTLGQLIAFRIIAGNVTGPVLQLAGLYQGFQKVQLSMDRLADIVDQTPEFETQDLSSQIVIPPIRGDVRFDHVSFRFGKSGPYQLDDVSVSVNSGSFVGIVGQSGSGKSTLMKLLPRLYNPERGKIYIDGYDISKVDLSSIRRQVGIVPQDSLLFEGTVAENISLNDPQASTESVIEAAKIACAHDFIMDLPNGYATRIVERGSNLSGGQRQRIAIARTILANPHLLVMDEATSALDFDTERQLCLNLQEWSKGKTVFFITHRLPTIKNSDFIIVMHQGCVGECGTHDELIALQGRYMALYKQQESVG